jgi:hypothetical protein
MEDVRKSCQCWALEGAHFSVGDLQVDTEIGVECIIEDSRMNPA